MYPMLKHAHSGLRWVVLLLLIVAIANALMKWRSGKTYTDGDRKITLFTMIGAHVQLILGLILYFISPAVKFNEYTMSDKVLRFYSVEHLTIMILAIALITIGYSQAKKKVEAAQKFRATFIYYLIGLLLILAGIPWPFRFPGAGWF
ncbi:MAG: cytochrome B [Lewinellaceae bacterium]|nr:cytochrome B [Phaeodactylibacter sp.]MCB9348829.1 cytochrome B [Lewinellaceae bacterium]